MHPHKPHATSQSSRLSHTYRPSCQYAPTRTASMRNQHSHSQRRFSTICNYVASGQCAHNYTEQATQAWYRKESTNTITSRSMSAHLLDSCAVLPCESHGV